MGLGAQDSVDDARAFVNDTGTDTEAIEMLWDPSSESWTRFEVLRAPSFVLLTPDGRIAERWSGFRPAAFLEAAEEIDTANNS